MALRATPGTIAGNRVSVFKPTGAMVTVADGASSDMNLNGRTIFRTVATGDIRVTVNGGAMPMKDGTVDYVELEAGQEFSVAADT